MIKFLLLLSMSFAPASDVELTFKSHGKITNKTVLSKLSKLALPQVVTVKDPNEGADIKFNAYPMKDILNKVYGKDWETAEEILFTCADGYQPAVPVSVFKKGQAFLAFERIGSEFSLVHKFENKKKGESRALVFNMVWRYPSLLLALPISGNGSCQFSRTISQCCCT